MNFVKMHLVKIENGKLTENSANQIINLEMQIRALQELQKSYKEALFDQMKAQDIKQIKMETFDGIITITKVDETSSLEFDKKKFKEDHLELYNEYLKIQNRKGYVKIDAKMGFE